MKRKRQDAPTALVQIKATSKTKNNGRKNLHQSMTTWAFSRHDQTLITATKWDLNRRFITSLFSTLMHWLKRHRLRHTIDHLYTLLNKRAYLTRVITFPVTAWRTNRDRTESSVQGDSHALSKRWNLLTEGQRPRPKKTLEKPDTLSTQKKRRKRKTLLVNTYQRKKLE